MTRRAVRAAERVRRNGGFKLVLDHPPPSARSEDITETVIRELAQAPSSGPELEPAPTGDSKATTQHCAALFDAERAPRDSQNTYDKAHARDAQRIAQEREGELIELLLKIERERIRAEEGYTVIAESSDVVTAAHDIPDVTWELIERFTQRFVRFDSAALDPQATAVQRKVDGSEAACSAFARSFCSGADVNTSVCEAAWRTSTRMSASACVAATTAPAPRTANASGPLAACARLVDKTCHENGASSSACSGARATAARLSNAGCAFMLTHP